MKVTAVFGDERTRRLLTMTVCTPAKKKMCKAGIDATHNVKPNPISRADRVRAHQTPVHTRGVPCHHAEKTKKIFTAPTPSDRLDAAPGPGA